MAIAIAKLASYTTGFDTDTIVRRYEYTPVSIEARSLANEARFVQARRLCDDADGYSRPNVQCSSYKTPVPGLYLCGASTFPGGMVTFGPGYNAAKVVAEELGTQYLVDGAGVVSAARVKEFLK